MHIQDGPFSNPPGWTLALFMLNTNYAPIIEGYRNHKPRAARAKGLEIYTSQMDPGPVYIDYKEQEGLRIVYHQMDLGIIYTD